MVVTDTNGTETRSIEVTQFDRDELDGMVLDALRSDDGVLVFKIAENALAYFPRHAITRVIVTDNGALS